MPDSHLGVIMFNNARNIKVMIFTWGFYRRVFVSGLPHTRQKGATFLLR